MVAEHGAGQDVVHLVLRLVLVHGDLLDHHLALGVDVGVDGGSGPCPAARRRRAPGGRRGSGSRRRSSPCRAGVDLRSHRVERLIDFERREAFRALEEQVLQEMRDPGLVGGFVAGARADREPEGDRADRGHRLGHHPDPRVEGRQARLARRSLRAVPIPIAARYRARGRPGRRSRGRAGRRPRSPAAVATAALVAGAHRRELARRDLPAISGSSARRRPMRPRSRSTSTTLTSQLVAAVDDVLHRVHPLTGLDVGDVQQAVGALGELDEGAEGGRLDDLAGRTRRRPRPPWSSSGCGP